MVYTISIAKSIAVNYIVLTAMIIRKIAINSLRLTNLNSILNRLAKMKLSTKLLPFTIVNC